MGKDSGRVSGGRPSREWFSRSEMAGVFGVTEKHFDRHHRRQISESAVQKVDRRLWFHGRMMVDAHVQHELGKLMPTANVNGDDDPLLSGDAKGSKMLEKYREEQWLIARLKRREMEDALVPRHEIREGLNLLVALFRKGIERLGRQHGKPAQKVMQKVFDDFKKWLEANASAGKGE